MTQEGTWRITSQSSLLSTSRIRVGSWRRRGWGPQDRSKHLPMAVMEPQLCCWSWRAFVETQEGSQGRDGGGQ